MAAANDEFLVKFKYWFVVGGIIILNAWGIITNFKTWFGVNPIDAAASFWPLLIPWIPALTHSAIKVAVYNAKAKVKAIEIVSITMFTYLTLSISISILMNWYNKKIAITEK